MADRDMFGDVAGGSKKAQGVDGTVGVGAARILSPNRQQMLMVPTSLDAQVARDHVVRAVWRIVESFDLSSLEQAIRARGSHAGRPAIDPRILVALWVYATIEGISCARELGRLCETHDIYRWICGGVHVNYHVLSDFRVDHPELVDQLLTSMVAVLEKSGAIQVSRVAHDGMRVRASAGETSFHRAKTLEKCLRDAKELVEQNRQRAQDAGERSQESAAKVRAAEEQEKRITQAIHELQKVQASHADKDPNELRASSTDPEARVMKMPDRGFRPAYNIHFATTTNGRGIVGVMVTNSGNDWGEMSPMTQEVARRVSSMPTEWVVDGGFAKKDDITALANRSITVIAPVHKSKNKSIDPFDPKPDDSPAVADWRRRMATPEAKAIYRERGSVAELVNADVRCHRGLDHIPVRGLAKARTVALWMAIAYNVMRWLNHLENEESKRES
jgi:transposase